MMNTNVCATALVVLCLLDFTVTENSPPVVQVYSRTLGVFNKNNTLLCHVSQFHPPVIEVDLLRNGVVIKEANQTELVFGPDWHFHVTKYVPFVPQSTEKYTCRVTHLGISREVVWEPDM
uniref:Beta-2-microglobulin n=1 Tax=Hippocampus comes TaxID=109280 RepID=A0A3Q2XQM7_HIPCM